MGLDFRRGPYSVRWMTDGSGYHVIVDLQTSVMVAVGEPSAFFVEPIGEVAGVMVFAMASSEPGDPRPWFRTRGAEEWANALSLGQGEVVEVWPAYLDGRLLPRQPEEDVHRVFRMVDASSLLPPPGPLQDVPVLLPEMPDAVAAALEASPDWIILDDVEREARIDGATTGELRLLVSRVKPLLPTIDSILSELAARPNPTPGEVELEIRLNALAQAAIEAELVIARNPS